VFNLLPLLPLDGGHIAVNLYERVRDTVRAWLGKPKMPPVDYTRLLPLTYLVILVGGAVSLLTLAADIVNPIRLG
jgi:membrane-associated protease RseP (regulator of RpoE activity)